MPLLLAAAFLVERGIPVDAALLDAAVTLAARSRHFAAAELFDATRRTARRPEGRDGEGRVAGRDGPGGAASERAHARCHTTEVAAMFRDLLRTHR